MRIGSLFSGVGGLDLGLEQSGLGETVFQVERDPYCRAVLARHWPNALRFNDVCTVGAAVLPPIDLLCGGFPCTDVSSAGKRKGLGTRAEPTRSGLWFEFDRLIGELSPRWVVIENVASGGKNWLPIVRGDLWTRGYASLPIRLLASDVGARHRRARVFVIASRNHELIWRASDAPRAWDFALSEGAGLEGYQPLRGGEEGPEPACDAPHPDSLVSGQGEGSQGRQRPRRPVAGGGASTDPHSDPLRVQPGRGGGQERLGQAEPGSLAANFGSKGLEDGLRLGGDVGPTPGAPAGGDASQGGDGLPVYPGFGYPPLPALRRAVHGVPDWMDRVARSAGWTSTRGPAPEEGEQDLLKWARRRDKQLGKLCGGWTPALVRMARIKALGNAVVPKQVEPIGRLILFLEQLRSVA